MIARLWRRLFPPPVRTCNWCNHPADRVAVVGGREWPWCWLHAHHIEFLIRLSPPEPEEDPCGQRFPGPRPR